MQWEKGPPRDPKDPENSLLVDDYSTIKGMDPKANWLFGPGLSDYLPPLDSSGSEGRLIPFLIRFRRHQDAVRFPELLNSLARHNSQIFVPGRYRPWLTDDRFSRWTFAAIATKRFFDQVADPDKGDPALIEDLRQFQQVDKVIRLSDPLLGLSLKPDDDISFLAEQSAFLPVLPPSREWPQDTVVMAVIDDGLAIANERFRETNAAGPPNPDQSRVQFLWCMPPTAGSPLGKELAKDDATIPSQPGIDSHLRDSSTNGVIDEDDFYRRSGLVDMSLPDRQQATVRRASHGAHVLDVAAGADPSDPVGGLRPIIGAQLPVSTVEDTSGAQLEAQLVLALDYVLDRSDAIARAQPGAPPDAQLPIVVNCSYGFIAAPHDGESALELALDQRVRDRTGKLRIVLPAGNSNLSRCHASFDLDPTVPEELRWRVQPDDRTLSHVEVWMPEGFDPVSSAPRVHLSVETPSGLASTDPPLGSSGVVEEGDDEILVLEDDDGAVLALAAYAFHPPVNPGDPPTSGRGMFCVILQPTARLQPTSDPTAASGIWKIRLHNQNLLDAGQEIHAWIQRDDTPFGYPIRGRQSYFDHADYQRFSERTTPVGSVIEEDSHVEQAADCPIKRAGLINAIATGDETIVIGGYVGRDDGVPGVRQPRDLAPYSAGGPTSGTRDSLPPPSCLTVLSQSPDGPDASAPSDRSRILLGIPATGTRSNSTIALNGTSVAAPHIARWVADNLSGDLPSREDVQAAACNDPFNPEKPDRGGAGRIG